MDYKGEQRDAEANLVYLRARHYDPTTGSFISKDPVEGALTIPQSQNGYSYVHHDPINLSDPSGKILPIVAAALVWGYRAYVACDAASSVASGDYAGAAMALVTGPVGKGAKVVKGVVRYTPNQIARFERQLVEDGAESLVKSRSSLQKQVIAHEQKIAEAKRSGGYTSSMERELQNFNQQINAIDTVLGR